MTMTRTDELFATDKELLRGIYDELRKVNAQLAALAARPVAAAAAPPVKIGNTQVEPADDADLDSEWGNPEVRFDPKFGWDGASHVGLRFSDCPAAYLDLIAKGREAMAAKKEATDPQKAQWDRREAARARGWAKRNRKQVLAEAKEYPMIDASQDDVGF